MARRLVLALVAARAAALVAPGRPRAPMAPRAAATELPPFDTQGSPVAEAELAYDPKRARELLQRQPGRWLTRNVQLAFPLLGFVVSVAGDRVLDRELVKREQRASELLGIIADLGPAVIKGGQALASRPDLLPAEYLRKLQELQDRVPAFPTPEALKRVEASLGLRNFTDVFTLLVDAPVAAASIGQVYKAKLRNGKVVALKVQRPECERIIALDLFVLRWWAQLGTRFFGVAFGRDLDLVSVVDDFGALIYREIDYRAEALNMKKFGAMYQGYGNTIRVPEVYDELTTSTVLCMEWVDGTRLVDGAQLQEYTGDPASGTQLVDALVQCSLRQMLDSGFFHADPHAGNLLATKDNRLCYLDFGMMSYLEERQRVSIIEAIVHLVNRDFEALADLYVRMGFIKQGTNVEPIVRGLRDALPDVLDAPVSELNVKNIAAKLGDVMYTFPFALPPYYVAIIRCLGVLEGVAIQVDPGFRIVNDAYPYVAARLLTDESPELRRALTNLLFKDQTPQWSRFEALLNRASSSSEYDASAVASYLITALTEESAGPLREKLVDDLADALDYLGVGVALDFAAALGVDLPEPPAFLDGHYEGAAPPAAAALLAARDFLLGGDDTGDVDLEAFQRAARKVRPVAQSLVDAPALRAALVEILARVSERAASRAIRLALRAVTDPEMLRTPAEVPSGAA